MKRKGIGKRIYRGIEKKSVKSNLQDKLKRKRGGRV